MIITRVVLTNTLDYPTGYIYREHDTNPPADIFEMANTNQPVPTGLVLPTTTIANTTTTYYIANTM